MPSKAKKVDRDVAKLPSIPKALVDLFLTGPMTGEAQRGGHRLQEGIDRSLVER